MNFLNSAIINQKRFNDRTGEKKPYVAIRQKRSLGAIKCSGTTL